MVKWEYDVVPLPIDRAKTVLNAAGSQGWRLAAVIPRGRESESHAIFERETSSTPANTTTPAPSPSPGVTIKL